MPKATSVSPDPETAQHNLAERIKSNALTVWPGEGRTFEIRFIRDAGGSAMSAILVEVGDAKGAPRTMSGFYNTEEEALQDLNKQLEYLVEEKQLFEEGGAS